RYGRAQSACCRHSQIAAQFHCGGHRPLPRLHRAEEFRDHRRQPRHLHRSGPSRQHARPVRHAGLLHHRGARCPEGARCDPHRHSRGHRPVDGRGRQRVQGRVFRAAEPGADAVQDGHPGRAAHRLRARHPGVRSGRGVRRHRHAGGRGQARRPDAGGSPQPPGPRAVRRQHRHRRRLDAGHQQHHRLRRKRLGRAG
ncbi:hypothetical protein OY671_009738, partial [Metschnikowia pulcherrima]